MQSFHRRPTRADVDDQLQVIGASTHLPDPTQDPAAPSRVDVRVYLEVTGTPPRWRPARAR